MEETRNKVCETCGRELPYSAFSRKPNGEPWASCRECVKEKKLETRYGNALLRGGGGCQTPFSDPDFDGRDIGDVWRQMCRAKKWLESRGCKILLDGKYIEVKERKLKVE